MDRFKRIVAPLADAVSSLARRRAAAPPKSGSGDPAVRYELMRKVLLSYLSPILVHSVLEKGLATRNLTPASLTPTQLAELASDIMVGLRLFVPETQLPKLMLELADVLEIHE